MRAVLITDDSKMFPTAVLLNDVDDVGRAFGKYLRTTYDFSSTDIDLNFAYSPGPSKTWAVDHDVRGIRGTYSVIVSIIV